MLDALVLDLGVDLVAVDFGVAVDLVEHEDDGLLGFAQLGQGFDLGALHVAGDDEEEQVAVPGDFAGQGLADFAADLVDARGIDDDQLGPFEAGPAGGVVLPSLGARWTVVPWVAPTGRRPDPCKAFKTDDLPRLTMPKAAISIVDSLELLAEVAQLRQLAGERGFFLGSQLEAGEGGFEAFLGAFDRLVFVCDLTFQLAEQFLSSGSAMG